MPEYKAPLDDIRFLLHNVFNLEDFCSRFPAFEDVDTETMDAILEEAAKICEQVIAPLDAEGDANGACWEDGRVVSSKGFASAYKEYSDGGWGALGGDPTYEGMGMPKTLVSGIEEMVQGANMAFGLAPMLTAGACLALQAHGSEQLKSDYLPRMYSGQWCGAMDLTEAHSGTDLGLLRTKAIPIEGGSYALTGTKIFITWGEHDMAENIVHLVLAKLPDALPGSRGISLFLVPKYLPNGDGSIGQANGVSCGSIEHKMGIHGSPTCVMNFDGAKGWLIGEANQGLACMFTMMNYERLVVGIQGIGVAESSYQTARDYALDRIQGRAPTGTSNPGAAADPIIVHPDVRRMLMEMKSLNEASRAFYIYVARWLDTVKYSDDKRERTLAEKRVALLTPVAKAFMTDRALDTCILGQQVLGGHGYIAEWGQEQKVRDVRITQIYEGTNGVQAMDLVGRKTIACRGELLASLVDEMNSDMARACELGLDANLTAEFSNAVQTVEDVTTFIIASEDKNLAGAVAVDYLDCIGYLCFAHMWLLMFNACETEQVERMISDSKRATGSFYFKKILPAIGALAARIHAGATPTMTLEDELF